MKPEILNISNLLHSDRYVIPLYQRNYSWGEPEVVQLMQDVWDKFQNKDQSKYYIGTLIVDKRDDKPFEIIDGQQRHTTITLINAVFKDKTYGVSQACANCNITFAARPEIQQFLDQLTTSFKDAWKNNLNADGLDSIQGAVHFIEYFLADKEKKHGDELQGYVDYFYNRVEIVRIGVPENTDINHYFEIMNTRGEQLEQHEILKAAFLSKIEEKQKFALIWDACSQINRPIQQCFGVDNRKVMFGQKFTNIPASGMSSNIVTAEASSDTDLETIVKDHKTKKDAGDNGNEAEERFRSVIDFPNFLLHVLKLTKPQVALDDKSLLKSFGYPNSLPDSTGFINSLLYYRTLFDKYIVKRDESSQKWVLYSLEADKDSKVTFRNTFGSEPSADQTESNGRYSTNEDMVMLQTCLHVSAPSYSNKNWLYGALSFFHGGNSTSFSVADFKKCLLGICKSQLGECGENLNRGTGTNRFAFNFLDYLLWFTYDRTKLDAADKKKFVDFRFRQNNSVEHLHAQSRIEELELPENRPDITDRTKVLDHFGNLCLISSSSNSRYSDLEFAAKRSHFKKNPVESLKQVLMFANTDWNTKEILDHGEKMYAVLNSWEASVKGEPFPDHDYEMQFTGKPEEILALLKHTIENNIAPVLGLDVDFDEYPGSLGTKDTGFWFFRKHWKHCIYFYFSGHQKNMFMSVTNRTKDDRCDPEVTERIKKALSDLFIVEKELAPDDESMWIEKFAVWNNTSWNNVLERIPDEITVWSNKVLDKLSKAGLN